jgi:3',5'-cyclic AMP phosphodiesterase CpdA
MPTATYTLRILHLSDLHERGSREAENWRKRRVLGDKWEENLDAIRAAEPVDLVCFTGDTADWGKPEEYLAATDFFRCLMARLRLPMERLFLTPGNHDIDRDIDPEIREKLRDTFQQCDGLTLSRWLAGTGEPPPGADADWLDAVLARQGAYRRWLRALGREELDPSAHAHGRVGYRISLRLPALPFPVQVIGLDTAWLAGEKYDAQKLWLTDEQIMRHAADEQGRPLPGLRLALCHHPLWDLADHERAANLLAENTDLLLRGHLHHPALKRRPGSDRELMELAAGCLYEGHSADEYPNGCQLIHLRLDSSGRPVSAEPWFRAWSPEGHWHNDDSRYANSHEGRVVWPFTPPAPTGGGNPYDFIHPAVPPVFVGRLAMLDSLARALDETASVSLIGDRRIGKSSALETFALRAREMGRTVKVLSGEGKEAASLSAFVAAITGKTCPEQADQAADALSTWAERSGKPGLAPLLLLDEAEIFLRQFDYRFFERLRGLLDRLCLVLATHKPIDMIFQQRGQGSPFDNKLRIECLGLLEEIAVDALLRRGNGNLDGEDFALMRRWAGRHPYFLQLLGYRLVEASRLGETREDALDKARQDGYARLRHLWANLTDREKQALRHASAGTSSNHSRLRVRGLLEPDGRLFGEVLAEWLAEEDAP